MKKWILQVVNQRFEKLSGELAEHFNSQLNDWLEDHEKWHSKLESRQEEQNKGQKEHAKQVEAYLSALNAILEKKL